MHRQIAGKLTGPVTKWIVLVVVLVLTGLLGGYLGGKLADVKNNEQSSWVPASAESTKVADELSGTVSPNDIPTLVAYHRSGGLTEADLAAIDAQAAGDRQDRRHHRGGRAHPQRRGGAPGAGTERPDLISDDGEVAYTYFTFNMARRDGTRSRSPSKRSARSPRWTASMSTSAGFGGQAYDFVDPFDGSQATLLLITLRVVILILLITYRSPILWILPIFCAFVANTMAGGVVYLLAKYADLVVNDQSQSILSILVIGAGTDYALLLVARYREELRRHEDRHEAMAFALHRATPAILASAATVVVGLMCLAFADLNSTASLGPVLAVGIAVTFLVMVTLLPALLVIFGRWIFWPFAPAFGSTSPPARASGRASVAALRSGPGVIWIGTTVALLVACLGLFKLDANGLETKDTFTKTFDSVTAPHSCSRTTVSPTGPVTVQLVSNADQLAEVTEAVAGVDGLGERD